MILFASKMIKVLLVVMALLGGWILFKRKLPQKALLLLAALTVLAAFVSNLLVGYLPPLTDEVRLTALGEQNSQAKSSEVYLSGYTIDGVKFTSGESLEIAEGHWFWSGETYAWRPETDSRQPDGMTRTVVLRIPVGWLRTLNFSGGVYRGSVEISAGGRSWNTDTYSKKSATVPVEIGRSETSALIFNQIRYLTAYLLLFSALFGLILAVEISWKKIELWNQRHTGVLIFGVIALFQFALAVKYSGIDCFWMDELYEIGWSAKATTLSEAVFVGHAPLPIFRLFFHFWYSIAPYGERWLLLPFEIGTAVGVFFIGLCGKEWRGVRAGTFSALFAAGSSTILVQCSYEVRSYGFYFASAAVLLYLYLRSWRVEKRPSEIVLLAVAMTFFAGMHYHAVIFCIALFMVDAFAFLCLKVKTRSIWPYLVSGMSYIPNIVCILKKGTVTKKSFTGSSRPVPTLREVKSLCLYLSGESVLIACLFLLGAAVLIVSLVSRAKAGVKENQTEMVRSAVPLFLVVFVLAFFLVNGNLISSSLWSNRYFSDLLPCFLLICGLAVDYLCELTKRYALPQLPTSSVLCVFLCLLILPTTCLDAMNSGTSVRQPYRDPADWLYTQANYIYNDDTLILSVSDKSVIIGWNDYYLTRQGRRDPVQIASAWSTSSETLAEYQRIYLVTIYRTLPNGALSDTLASDYKIVETQSKYHITVYEKK